ncbi:DinB family protein [Pedobacter glucosidilyticus]|uniref:DinB family protein n=1 Tax=Pedobacter glucosidilyticus TaxID=1122941 RepID=UPI0004008DB4|nr:DinB family protein [Pedobacter glucosidilyticus]
MYQPFSNEYAPYYEGYIKLVSGQNILRKLKNQLNEVDDFLAEIPAEKHDYAYADGKWTVKEVVAHLIDTERVMAYRAMRFSRNDFTPLPGFDQDLYMQNVDVSKRSFSDLVDELLLMRQANLYFFKSLTEEDYKKKGVASEREVSVGALLFIMAGHIEHHFRVLKEKYLK